MLLYAAAVQPRVVRHEEVGMGTWGTGPFDNDTAADFSGELDDAASLAEREDLVRGVLTRTLKAIGYLAEAEKAVAAAALIAAQCPGGEPVGTVYGPRQPLPAFPEELRELGAKALDRVLADESGLSEGWVDPADARQWLSSIKALRDALDPLPASLDVPLFDL
jgi:Domain of unknown function (DUF4259)